MAREYDHLFKLLIIGDSGNYASLTCLLCLICVYCPSEVNFAPPTSLIVAPAAQGLTY